MRGIMQILEDDTGAEDGFAKGFKGDDDGHRLEPKPPGM